MRILGIETSCDETAAAVVENGTRIISNVVNSQIDIHAKYGGVVPEVAARSHIEVINAVIDEAVIQAAAASASSSSRLLSDCNPSSAALGVEGRRDKKLAEKGDDPWNYIDAIAVTYAPGLIGSLLVGTLAARTLAITKHKPLYPIHHIESHIYANWLGSEGNLQKSFSEPYPPAKTKTYIPDGTDRFAQRAVLTDDQSMTFSAEAGAGGKDLLRFPVLALVVSGGHTQLILLKNHGDFEIIGTTRDDAVGEVFDKVAKIIGLPYPGGPSISKAALRGDRLKYSLPKAKLKGEEQTDASALPAARSLGRTMGSPQKRSVYDFSFSGLKTAVLRAVQAEVGKDFTFPSAQLPELLNDAQRQDFAASFEKTAVDTLVDKLLKAYDEFQPKTVVIAGGVSANQYLREQIEERIPIPVDFPPIEFCTDNAAMVASAGYFHTLRDQPADPYDLEVTPSLRLV